MNHAALIADYLAGPAALRQAIAGMTPAQLDAAPIPGQVVNAAGDLPHR